MNEKDITDRDLIKFLSRASGLDPLVREQIKRQIQINGSRIQRWVADFEAKMSDPFNIDWVAVATLPPDTESRREYGSGQAGDHMPSHRLQETIDRTSEVDLTNPEELRAAESLQDSRTMPSPPERRPKRIPKTLSWTAAIAIGVMVLILIPVGYQMHAEQIRSLRNQLNDTVREKDRSAEELKALHDELQRIKTQPLNIRLQNNARELLRLGLPTAALGQYEILHSYTHEKFKKDPTDAGLLSNYIGASVDLAKMYATNGSYQKAGQLFDEAILLSDQMAMLDKSGRSKSVMATVYQNFAEFEVERIRSLGLSLDTSRLLQLISRSIELRRELDEMKYPTESAAKDMLAAQLISYARVLQSLLIENPSVPKIAAEAARQEALQAASEALNVIEQVKEPTDAHLERKATALDEVGKLAKDEARFEEALVIRNKLAEKHQDNMRYLENVAVSRRQYGLFWEQQGKYVEAERDLLGALEIYRQMSDIDRDDVRARIEVNNQAVLLTRVRVRRLLSINQQMKALEEIEHFYEDAGSNANLLLHAAHFFAIYYSSLEDGAEKDALRERVYDVLENAVENGLTGARSLNTLKEFEGLRESSRFQSIIERIQRATDEKFGVETPR